MSSTQAEFDMFLRGKHGEVNTLVRQLAEGVITLTVFARLLREVLVWGHAGAAYYGRQRAGDVAPFEADDVAFGRYVAASQDPYLEAFLTDIRQRRYHRDDLMTAAALAALLAAAEKAGPGSALAKAAAKAQQAKAAAGAQGATGLLLAPLLARAALYVARMVGTANEAFARASDPGTLIYWRLDDAQHCGTCPRRAAGSPYTAATLPGYPRDGSTECMVNCKCYLVRADGVRGFAPA